jgi:hypothetical protein
MQLITVTQMNSDQLSRSLLFLNKRKSNAFQVGVFAADNLAKAIKNLQRLSLIQMI